MIIVILVCLAGFGWMRYFMEKSATRFFEERHLYWYEEAVRLKEALFEKNRRVEGDEWKN